MQQNPRPLEDLKVLVTRPKQRAEGLCELIESAGGTARHFAAIEISDPADNTSRDYVRAHIGEFDLAVFISPTAVEKTLDDLGTLPDRIMTAAIGSKTARVLASRGVQLDILPGGHDSEALLAHPELQRGRIAGKKIVIFRGEDGRPLLGDTLQARGAFVFYAGMYRRSPPAQAAQLDEFLQDTDVVTISSNAGLQNLYDLASDKQGLTGSYLIVPGARGQALAKALGFKHVIVAENATDEACLDALKYARVKMGRES